METAPCTSEVKQRKENVMYTYYCKARLNFTHNKKINQYHVCRLATFVTHQDSQLAVFLKV